MTSTNSMVETQRNMSGPETIGQAIRSRRSAKRVLQTPIDRATIERLLEAATWAPSHHLTEPWRFWVIRGDARRRFGEAMAAGDLSTHQDATPEQRETMRASAIGKAHRAPLIIAVAAVMAEGNKNPDVEEITATAAAIQNLLLQAEAEGLGTIWRTGRSAYEPEMARFFGLGERDQMLGFLYIGHPDPDAPARTSERRPLDQVTTWLDD
jgi:nitroreductase